MKAWTVFSGDHPHEDGLLVFAETRNAARRIGVRERPDVWEYVDIKAWRAPAWDGAMYLECCLLNNAEIPAGFEPFYREDGRVVC